MMKEFAFKGPWLSFDNKILCLFRVITTEDGFVAGHCARTDLKDPEYQIAPYGGGPVAGLEERKKFIVVFVGQGPFAIWLLDPSDQERRLHKVLFGARAPRRWFKTLAEAQAAAKNIGQVRLCTCGSGEPWANCPGNPPGNWSHCG